jgi:hypothetical protein
VISCIFNLTEAYLVDGGRFTFTTMDAAVCARNVFVPGANIQVVLAVQTPQGLVLTNPIIVLEEHHG